MVIVFFTQIRWASMHGCILIRRLPYSARSTTVYIRAVDSADTPWTYACRTTLD